jgi:hypothetical protein
MPIALLFVFVSVYSWLLTSACRLFLFATKETLALVGT